MSMRAYQCSGCVVVGVYGVYQCQCVGESPVCGSDHEMPWVSVDLKVTPVCVSV